MLAARFDEHLERAYQADLLDEKTRLARMIAVLALVFNVAFYVLDHFAVASALSEAVTVRAVMFLVPLALLVVSYQEWFSKVYVASVTCGLATLGLCINALIAIAGPQDLAGDTYYAGLILVAVAMHMLTFVPLGTALYVSLILLTSYVSVVIGKPGFHDASQAVVLTTNLFFFASVMLIGVVGQVLRDRYTRDNFILRHSLQRDVAVEEEKHRLAAYLAEHDVLTGLPNRLRFERLGEELVEQVRSLGGHVVVLFIDVDNFKPVNDQHGYAAGDRVLRMLAERIGAAVGGDGVAARFGGDEYVVCLRLSGEEIGNVGFHAARIASAIQRGIDVRGHQLHMTASIGAAAFPLDGDDLQSVLEVADAQMYRAKQIKGEISLSVGIETRNRRSPVDSEGRLDLAGLVAQPGL